MSTQADITQMFQYLIVNGIEPTEKFIKQISQIIDRKPEDFISTFSKDMLIFVGTNRVGKVTEVILDDNKRKKFLGTGSLFRYEYRKYFKKNVRCLVVLEETGKCVCMRAFIDDGDKSKGGNSYKENIELALKDYRRRKEEIGE